MCSWVANVQGAYSVVVLVVSQTCTVVTSVACPGRAPRLIFCLTALCCVPRHVVLCCAVLSNSSKDDYIYAEELQQYEKSGVLTLLHVAFSRDGPSKVCKDKQAPHMKCPTIRRVDTPCLRTFFLC